MGLRGQGQGQKDIRIEMPTPAFPRLGDLRVNWGESLDNIATRVVNDSDEKIDVKLKILVRNENADIKELHNEDVTVSKNSRSNLTEKIKLDLNKTEFPNKGKHYITCQLIINDKVFDKRDCTFFLEADPPKTTPPKDIRIEMPTPAFPRLGDLRVNWGESLDNIAVRVVNDTAKDLEAKIKIVIRDDDNVIKELHIEDVKVGPNSQSNNIGNLKLEITEKEFPNKGKHYITCRLISMMQPTKGYNLDKKECVVYIEEDPPDKDGIFEKYQGITFQNAKGKELLMAAYEKTPSGTFILNYNVDHAAHKKNGDDENAITRYLFEIGVPEICLIDLVENESALFKKEHKEHPDLVVKRMREILGESAQYLNEVQI